MTRLSRTTRWAALPLLLALAGCADDAAQPSVPPSVSPSVPPSAPASVPAADRVEAVLGGVALRLEVADDPAERATGLMGRTSVPPGTGMLFRYAAPVQQRFYMFRVPVPLTAAFVHDGVVVHVVDMAPCAATDPDACPRYGPDRPFDAVVEAAPDTLAGVRVGDRLELGG